MDGATPVTPMSTNVLLLYAARGIRGFGDGFAIIILPAYLSAIGMTPVQIGIVATAALLGTSLMTLAIGFVAPRHDMRNLLLAGAALMAATGAAFPQAEHIAFILLVAFLGTINPVNRGSRRAGAPGTRHAGAERPRRGADAHLRPL